MAYDHVLLALADPTRRRILESLRAAPQSVGELAAGQPVTRPAVSQHLKVLQDAGLVGVQPHGTRRIYSVRRHGLVQLRKYLDDFWADMLDGYSAEIERRLEKKRLSERKE